MMLDELRELTRHHRQHCKLYGDFVTSYFGEGDGDMLANLPYLPVRAFKSFDLKSVSDDAVYKVMTSSGTSGARSRIHLDKQTAQAQTRALISILSDSFGQGRVPMLVIDAESTVKDRRSFSARTAAINGFSIMARGRCFALDDDMSLNLPRVRTFLDQHQGQRIFIFGFTSLVWQYLVERLADLSETLPLAQAFLLHGGGWKKLADRNITNKRFKAALAACIGCRDVHNYYGMVEQTGTIFMECPKGSLHASAWSDAIARDPVSHRPLPHGQVGVLQLFSTIQRSYPGHSLLTEDVGLTRAAEACGCGHPGTVVELHGRLAAAEVRGCSDAYP